MKTTQNKFYELLKTNEAVFDFFQQYALDSLVYQDLSKPEHSWINAKLFNVLGYKENDKKFTDNIYALLNNAYHLQEIKSTPNYTREICFRHETGKEIWMLATSIYYANNDVIVTALKDINKTKEHELILDSCNQQAQIGYWEIDLMTNTTPFWSKVTRSIHEVPDDYIPSLSNAILF